MATPRRTRATRSSARNETPSLPPPEPTPLRRSPRRRLAATPSLPALTARTSHAYGAEGRIVMAEGISTRTQGDISGALQNTLGDAVDSTSTFQPVLTSGTRHGTRSQTSRSPSLSTKSEQIDEPAPEPLSVPQTSTRARARASPVTEAHKVLADNGQLNPAPSLNRRAPSAAVRSVRKSIEQVNNTQASQSHHNNHGNNTGNTTTFVEHTTQLAAGQTPEAPQGFVRADSEHLRANDAPVAQPVVQFVPLWLDFVHFFRAHLTSFLVILAIPFLITLIATFFYYSPGTGIRYDLASAANNGSVIDSIKNAGNSVWTSVGSVLNKAIPTVQVDNSRINKLEGQFTLLDETLDKLMEILPRHLVVTSDEESEIVIPERFWQAIKERIHKDSDLGKPTPAWDEFIAKNQHKVNEVIDRVRKEGEKKLLEGVGKEHLVRTQTFVEELERNYIALHKEIQEESGKLQQQLAQIIQRPYNDKHDDTGIPAAQVLQLAQANILKNAEDAMKRVDFFSAKLGSRINPTLTSPTFKANAWFYERAARFFHGLTPLAPIHALLPWLEAGDCWCAAKGRAHNVFDLWGAFDKKVEETEPVAQLAVAMARPVIPRSVTVEHIPQQGTLDPDAAPVWMELWVDMPLAANHSALEAASNDVFSRASKWQMPTSDRREGIAIPITYVLIGKFRYDRDGPNHVQNFPVDVETRRLIPRGFNDAIVRVITNSGSDHTCLYRIKLHGDAI